MKLIKEVKAIIAKYELKPIMFPEGHNDIYSFLKAYPNLIGDYQSKKNDEYLFKKYRKNIPKGWYGFDIGHPIIPDWMEILDEIVEQSIKADPNFEIHQIKLKFGGIRFYVESAEIEDIYEIASLVENTLYDDALIY